MPARVMDIETEEFFGDDLEKVSAEYLHFLKVNGIDKKRIINVSHAMSVQKARIMDTDYHSMYYYFSILLTYETLDLELKDCEKCTKLINQVQEHIELKHKRKRRIKKVRKQS